MDFHRAFASVDTAPLLGGDVTGLHIVDASIAEVCVDGGLVTFTQQVHPDAPFDPAPRGGAGRLTAARPSDRVVLVAVRVEDEA